MDWKLVFTTFGAVFLAELGDKTQLATFTFATSARSRWAVFIGAATALVANAALAVVAGELVGRAIPPLLLKRVAGVGFVAIGIWVLWSSRT
jgi:Ca2+/H+ antiporter, TMEM165/GDT1 family